MINYLNVLIITRAIKLRTVHKFPKGEAVRQMLSIEPIRTHLTRSTNYKVTTSERIHNKQNMLLYYIIFSVTINYF